MLYRQFLTYDRTLSKCSKLQQISQNYIRPCFKVRTAAATLQSFVLMTDHRMLQHPHLSTPIPPHYDPTALGPARLTPITQHTYFLKLSGPHVGEEGQATYPWLHAGNHHFISFACGLGQNGSHQTNCFVLLPQQGLHIAAEASECCR